MRSPWWYVPTLYLMEGLPYFLVTEFAVVMYKRLGMPNDDVAFWTSLLAWPWTLKLLWSPAVELLGTRRRWMLACQGLLLATTLAFALTAPVPSFLVPTLLALTAMAFVSATHDVATDGYYLLALDEKRQALFSGIRSTAYRIARIVASGGLVWAAGQLEQAAAGKPSWLAGLDEAATGLVADPQRRPWVVALLVAAALQGVTWAWNLWAAPVAGADRPGAARPDRPSAVDAIAAFFRQPRIGWVLAFVFLYRFPEQMVNKMAQPFLLDEAAEGGLGVSTADVGLLVGTLGVICLVVGGIAGGALIARFGLSRCFWPLVAAMHLPNLLYLGAAIVRPGLAGAGAVVAIEQLGYGFGFAAYTVFLLQAARGTRSPTSSYAVATGLMAFGAFLAGTLAGFLQVRLGYVGFYAVVCLISLPAVLPVLAVRGGASSSM